MANRPGRRSRGHGARRTKRRAGLGWRVWLALAVVAAGTGLLGWGALARRLAPVGNTEQARFDTIVVLGTPADADGNPTPAELARVNEAVREYERGVAPRMVMSGGAAHNRFVEAEVMARAAEAEGIPAGAVLVEGRSKDTIQNVCYTEQLMRAHGWRSAEVITEPAHLPRAGLILSRTGLEWRTHAAPTLEAESGALRAARAALETLKTARYVAWTRQTERCGP